ncbi:MAG: hypothetical protein UGF43_06530 [Blautia sp.]|uniref:hypothetical protein n=1 Tax=Blautia sp. TaxID=1955243 RepID=UPI002E7A18F2|nr:hypothetical protein [Blautia sp.]MEE1443259.1 hypothetical protein [Blautia sp.]
MELIKNALFNLILILGLIAICFTILWWILELLNRIFRFSKIIICYLQYKRNIDTYNFTDKLIVSKNGDVLYTCIGDLDKQIEILEKAIQSRREFKVLQDKYSK